MKLGIDLLLENRELQRELRGRRVALLGHAASVTRAGVHSLDALMAAGLRIRAAFGPQHGMRGDKQDNMIESPDYEDPRHHIPIFSLYGKVRYPTREMLDSFDVILVDLQDIGTRIYTYVTTLAYLLEACTRGGKAVWILDRPNPAGRTVEGSFLQLGWESFVGAAPLPMRHGLTLGELSRWLVAEKNWDLSLKVVQMQGYAPRRGPGYGWPLHELPWVNPSPNASSLNMARCFPGTVLFEGTHLSEGRGTTTPLEIIGAPDLDFSRLLARMTQLAPNWLAGCFIRPCYFEPTFHKHAGQRCAGIQIHTDYSDYAPERFHPYRLAALLLKSIRLEYPAYAIWRKFPYEYETERLAIDLLAGGTVLRDWGEDQEAEPEDLEALLRPDEQNWEALRQPFLCYGP